MLMYSPPGLAAVRQCKAKLIDEAQEHKGYWAEYETKKGEWRKRGAKGMAYSSSETPGKETVSCLKLKGADCDEANVSDGVQII